MSCTSPPRHTVCRQRIQQVTLGHRGRSGNPVVRHQKGVADPCDVEQKAQREAVFTDEEHIDVAVTERTFRHMRSGDHLCPQPHYAPQQKSHRLNQHIGAFRLNATGVSFHIL
jgi:hypothetical protein